MYTVKDKDEGRRLLPQTEITQHMKKGMKQKSCMLDKFVIKVDPKDMDLAVKQKNHRSKAHSPHSCIKWVT